jgi:hypothetical protein
MQWPRRIMRMISNPFSVAPAVFMLWKPRVGRITRERAMIRLKDVIHIFRGAVFDILRQQPFVL